MAISKLHEAKINFNSAESNIGNGNFKESLRSYDKIEFFADNIEDDLKWISTAISDAKKLEEQHKSLGFLAFAFNQEEGKTCFLFWCW